MSNVLVATPLYEPKINKIKKSGISHQMLNIFILERGEEGRAVQREG
jgi:hypothetical protein